MWLASRQSSGHYHYYILSLYTNASTSHYWEISIGTHNLILLIWLSERLDFVDHSNLEKLKCYGVTGNLLNWFALTMLSESRCGCPHFGPLLHSNTLLDLKVLSRIWAITSKISMRRDTCHYFNHNSPLQWKFGRQITKVNPIKGSKLFKKEWQMDFNEVRDLPSCKYLI